LHISRIKYANKALVGIRLFDSLHVAYAVWHAAYLRIPFRRMFPRYLALKVSPLNTCIRSSHLPRVLHALPVLYSWTSWSWKWGHYTPAKRLHRVTSKKASLQNYILQSTVKPTHRYHESGYMLRSGTTVGPGWN